MEAAKELFLEKRYNTITVDEIAERAGVTKRTMYKYYPSKLALFINMFDEYLQQLHLELISVPKLELSNKQLILKIFQVLYEFTKKNEKFMLLFWTLDSDEFYGLIPEELVIRIKLWTRAMIEEMTRFFEKAKGEGVVSKIEPEQLVHLISAINKGIFIHTNKENRFNISDIGTDVLYNICVDIFNASLFENPSESSE